MLCNLIVSGAAMMVFIAGAIAAAPAAENVVVAFGDSTTERRDEDGVVVYATLLEQAFAADKLPAKVVNAGKSGHTTADARARFEKDVLAHKPSLVIIQFGLNDAAVDVWKDPPATESRISKIEYEKNLRYFVQTLKSQDTQVILMTPNASRWTPQFLKAYGKPPYRPDDPDGFNIIVKDYAKIVRCVAREENATLIDVYQAFQAYDTQPGQKTNDLLVDGEHPSTKGHQLITDLLLATEPLRKMRNP
jgi:lysophospholipase L1-like esterase